MDIDWIKVSEIVFQALLTAIISAGLVYLAFRFGQQQAKEEQLEKEENALTMRRIDTLKIFIQSLLEYLDSSTSLRKKRIPGDSLITSTRSIRLRNAIFMATPFFPEEYDPELFQQFKIVDDHLDKLRYDTIQLSRFFLKIKLNYLKKHLKLLKMNPHH